MSKKILIVEDEAMLREMYVKKFSNAGYDVISAEDAETGLELIKKEKPALALLDVLLPKQNGLYLLKEIKKDKTLAKIKIVAFSNFDNPETKREAKALKVDDYLIKTDYAPKEIVSKVARYLK